MNAPASPRHDLPRWAEVLRQKYLAGEASTFVLYRNVFDNVLVGDKLHNLGAFLVEELFKDTKQHVCEVSLERGIRVLSGTSEDKQRALLRYTDQATILLVVYSAFGEAVNEGLWSKTPLLSLLTVAGMALSTWMPAWALWHRPAIRLRPAWPPCCTWCLWPWALPAAHAQAIGSGRGRHTRPAARQAQGLVWPLARHC